MKFRADQYAFYNGEVVTIIGCAGYKLDEYGRGQWYYKISGKPTDFRTEIVPSSSLTDSVNTEYERLQKQVGKMVENLERMLKDYYEYLERIDRLIGAAKD